MKHGIVWLAAASAVYASPHVFSVTDDLLAYPQYEVTFSDTFISDKEADLYLARLSSTLSTDDSSTSTSPEDASPATELSQRRPQPDPSDSTNQRASTPETYERMILHEKPYLCSIPQVSPPSTNRTTHAQAAQEEAAELARATDRGYDLLKSMSGNCLYFISGWWSYSFCYNNNVKQFHQLPPGKGTPIFPPVEDPTTPSYVLGKFGEVKNRFAVEGGERDKEAGLNPEERDQGRTTEIQAKGTSSSRYLSQKLSGGTTCDLTGSPRRVEIQFHCHPQSADRIGWIKEVSTCSYLMVIYTARLCNDVAFLPPRDERAESITCREVVKEEDIPAWESRKAAEASRQLLGSTATGSNTGSRPVVAGIEVGAQKLVGGEGRRLEPPQTGSHNHGQVHTGESKPVTLITRDPAEKGGKLKRLNDKEIRNMDLDPGVVESAKRELEEYAGDKGWHLEVFINAVGMRELRGIVDGENEGEEGDEFRGDINPKPNDPAGKSEDAGEDGTGNDEYEAESEPGSVNERAYGDGDDGDGEEEGSQEEYKDEL